MCVCSSSVSGGLHNNKIEIEWDKGYDKELVGHAVNQTNRDPKGEADGKA